MSINLSPSTQALLEERLKSGEYPSADAVIQAALTALDEREASELDEETLDGIDRAEDQIDRGQVYEWTDVRKKLFGKLSDE